MFTTQPEILVKPQLVQTELVQTHPAPSPIDDGNGDSSDYVCAPDGESRTFVRWPLLFLATIGTLVVFTAVLGSVVVAQLLRRQANASPTTLAVTTPTPATLQTTV